MTNLVRERGRSERKARPISRDPSSSVAVRPPLDAIAVEQRDADLVVVVLGAVGYAVENGWVIVDRPRPFSSDVIGSARHDAGRADSRKAGAMERQ